MPQLIQIGFNATTAKLYGADDQAKVLVSTLLSYLVDGYEYSDAFKTRGWDGRSTFFNYAQATFPRGFVDDVEAALKSKGYHIQRVCKPLPAPMGPENPVVDAYGDDPDYDYQMGTVVELLKRGSMIARVATGGGKSRIAKLCTARIARPTLFLTTRTVLLHQMKDDYIESGFDCGVLGDGEWDPKFINVAMVPTLMSRLIEPEEHDNSSAAMRQRRIRRQTIAYLETVELLIGEEAHESSGNGYFDLARYMRNAQYRIALTATPFMKDSAEANMRLKATFGPIGIDITEKMLIDRGILAKPYFKFINVDCAPGLRKTSPYLRAVELGIMGSLPRNTSIVHETARAKAYGLTTMILVGRKEHGKILAEMLTACGVRTLYIFGESTKKARAAALDKMKSGEIDCLIGSTILDVGVDVPAVGLLVIAGGGKAEVQLRQRIGRGLRRKKSGPNICLVVDYHDEHNKHLRTHAQSRQAIVTQTPGFAENVIANDDDFDYDKLGFRRVA
jgi:superfamily II DNA or RNA helicase